VAPRRNGADVYSKYAAEVPFERANSFPNETRPSCARRSPGSGFRSNGSRVVLEKGFSAAASCWLRADRLEIVEGHAAQIDNGNILRCAKLDHGRVRRHPGHWRRCSTLNCAAAGVTRTGMAPWPWSDPDSIASIASESRIRSGVARVGCAIHCEACGLVRIVGAELNQEVVPGLMVDRTLSTAPSR